MTTYNEAKARSEKKIKNLLNLKSLPKIYTVNRAYLGRERFKTKNRKALYISNFSQDNNFDYYDPVIVLNTPIEELHQSYCQLDRDRVKDGKARSFIIEVRIEFKENLTIAGGYEWAFLGRLNNKDKFLAVLKLKVRRIFRGCGLSSLIKFKELDLARKNTCDFIQTYHAADNPYFLSAITPSLNQGFVLYHGRPTGIEAYEEEGYIHLRKYLKRKTRSNVKVTFKDGTTFKTNRENHLILEYLKAIKGLPGKQILKIEEYGE